MIRQNFIKGQSLVEIFIAIAIGVIIVGSAVGAISLSLRKSFDIKTTQIASSLANEYMNSIQSVAESSWFRIYNPYPGGAGAKGTGHSYYLKTDTAPLDISPSGVGLIGYWSLDENSGSLAYDYSGNNAVGTIYSNPDWKSNINCWSGSCLNFDGSSNFINASQVLNTDKTKPFTLVAWVKPVSAGMGTWRTIIGTDSSLAEIAISSGNAITFGQNGGGGWFLYGPTVVINTWYNIVGVYDGTNAYLYVNGALKAGPSSQAFTNNHGVTLIGRYAVGGGEWMNGLIDDARIYNRALSAPEISDIYNTRPFVYSNVYVTEGVTTSVIEGKTFARYFNIENVMRDGSGNISETGAEDVSTQKITVKVSWEGGRSISISRYLSRIQNKSLIQSSWTQNIGSTSVPYVDLENKYTSSTNIATTTGQSIFIKNLPY